MLSIAYYFLQVVLCSGMMMGYYWLVLRNKRFHQYNRFYLLGIALLSWIVPLINIRWSHPVVNEDPQVFQFLSVVADSNSQIEESLTQNGFAWIWDMVAPGIYLLVAAVLLLGMLRAFYRLYCLLQSHSCKTVGEVYLILTHAKGTPFSFFRYIFWNEDIDIHSEAGKQILQHELTHVQQKHSVDKVLIQVMLVVGWFNPFFWVLRKEMDMIHEFIADKKAVNNGDTASLAQMLLAAAYPQQQFTLAHPFFFSPIKRRLQMLTNNKNPRFSYIRRLIVLPLLAIVVVLFAFRNEEQRANTSLSMASVVENVIKSAYPKPLADSASEKSNKRDTVILKADTIIVNGGSKMVIIDNGGEVMVKKVGSNSAIGISAKLGTALIILDGKKADNNILETLNPDLIQSVNVLKNESATALYGDDGKDGVIVITTKIYSLPKKNNEVSQVIEAESVKVKSEASSIPCQAIAKDLLGNLARNRKIFVKSILYQGAKTDDAKVWEEVQEVASDNDGVFTVLIGKGDKSSAIALADIRQIDWEHGPFFMNMKIAIAPLNQPAWWLPANNYIDLGTTLFRSIPYALYSGKHNLPISDFNSTANVGQGLILPANAITVTSFIIPGARKGDAIMVTREDKYPEWSVYSAWVEEDKLVKIRFANHTSKPVIVMGKHYRIVVIKTGSSGSVETFVVKTFDDEIQPANSSATDFIDQRLSGINEFRKHNPDVKQVSWKHQPLKMIIRLKDGTEETYDLSNTESIARAEKKYGKLPFAPPPPASRPYLTGYPTDSKQVFTVVQIPAAFPGGLAAWTKYLQRNLDTEIPAKNGAPPGKYTVIISFIVDKTGNLSNVKALNDPGYGTKEEAIRMIVKGPKWKPATQNGKNVKYLHTQSITFLVAEK